MSSSYKWWASSDEEHYTVGPCDSREQVIAEAMMDELGMHDDLSACSFHIIEATQEPIDLAKHFPVSHAIEGMCDSIEEDHGDHEGFASITEKAWSKEAQEDLERALRETVRAWQDRHEIVLTSWQFTQIRTREDLTIPVEDAA